MSVPVPALRPPKDSVKAAVSPVARVPPVTVGTPAEVVVPS